jgi:nicotinamide-nucleotide adenylyltransferase
MSPAPGIPMHQQLTKYVKGLSSFASSTANFRILHSVPQTTLPPPKTLYILDSSFNPPTLAHLRIATSALLHDAQPSASPKRLLLLLAIQNADKPPKPASFEQRLLMMQIFASDLRAQISGSKEAQIGVDVGVTKLPYFMDKSIAIEESRCYPPDTQQVHLTGFDTLIRILDPKYYPPEKKLRALDGFLEKHRLRVAYRTDDAWGAKEAQDEYLNELAEGRREKDGGKVEWAAGGRIVMCDGRKGGEETISSTKVRDAAKKGNKELLGRLVSRGVAEWILDENLYLESDP